MLYPLRTVSVCPRIARVSLFLFVAVLCGHTLMWTLLRPETKPSFGHVLGNLERSLGNKEHSASLLQTDTLRKRIKHMEQVCHQLGEAHWPGVPQKEKRLVQRDHGLLYCPIEKIGSSFWKRVFKVLNANASGVSKSLLSMPSMSAHGGLRKYMLKNKVDKNHPTVLDNYTSFMFVRDPFSRLLSGYLDKMLLPNEVGHNFFRWQLAHILHRDNTKSSSDCYLKTSFADFCKSIAYFLMRRLQVDHHFSPISSHCDPCRNRYDFLGKMETFMADTRAILSDVGVDMGLITEQKEEFDKEHELSILRDVIKRTFVYIKRGKAYCLSKREILKRVWLDFQIRGFIPMSSTFPYTRTAGNFSYVALEAETATLEDFESLARAAYSVPRTREERRQQREEAMIQAFRAVPVATLEQLSTAFRTDCQLFGYSCNVTERFFTLHS